MQSLHTLLTYIHDIRDIHYIIIYIIHITYLTYIICIIYMSTHENINTCHVIHNKHVYRHEYAFLQSHDENHSHHNHYCCYYFFNYYLLVLYMYRSMDMQRLLFPHLPLGAEDVGELLEAVDTPVFEKSAG